MDKEITVKMSLSTDATAAIGEVTGELQKLRTILETPKFGGDLVSSLVDAVASTVTLIVQQQEAWAKKGIS